MIYIRTSNSADKDCSKGLTLNSRMTAFVELLNHRVSTPDPSQTRQKIFQKMGQRKIIISSKEEMRQVRNGVDVMQLRER